MLPSYKNAIIADDHAVVRLGLQMMLDETPDIRIIEQVSNGDELLQKLATIQVDMVILDMMMPGRDTSDVLKEIKLNYPQLPVVIFSMNADDAFSVRMFSIGAAAYINKETPAHDLIYALRQVANNGRYINTRQSHLMMESLQNHEIPTPKAHEELSDREFQVFTLLALGRRKSEIASKLGIAINTVSNHRNNILKKMGFSQNTELTRYALLHGFIQ